MKMMLTIECDCGAISTFPLKRIISSHDDGRVYEDYSSITGGMEDNEFFKGKTAPDTVYVTCKVCGTGHELIT